MRNFRNMIIWNQGIDLAVRTYEIVKLFPKEELYGLRSQMTRAGVSVPSNIAEGCSRSSEKDFCRFLEMALGSAFEIETDLIIAQKIGYLKTEMISDYVSFLHSEQKQINKLINTIKH
jgi:four helix bundle protein